MPTDFFAFQLSSHYILLTSTPIFHFHFMFHYLHVHEIDDTAVQGSESQL